MQFVVGIVMGKYADAANGAVVVVACICMCVGSGFRDSWLAWHNGRTVIKLSAIDYGSATHDEDDRSFSCSSNSVRNYYS
jgi:hypothetical protein